MYYYAYINIDNGFCYDVTESEEQINDQSYIEVSGFSDYAEYYKYYPVRKTYENGEWRDTTVEEAERMQSTSIGERIAIFDEWLDIILNGKASLSHTHDSYATSNHTHIGYASSDDLTALEDIVDTKANATHTHSEYAASSHSHDNYATVASLDTLESAVNGKANTNHAHTEYASISHTHNEYAATNHVHSNYAESTHNHDTDYADINHNHNSAYASVGHDHDEDYATIDHTHTNYATTTALNEVSSVVSGKANTSHSHNDTYYTETEIDTKLSGKADSTHNHNNAYDAKGAAASALTSANAYTDSKIDALVGDGASTTLDTIGEISSAIEDNQDAIDLLNSAIGTKANISHNHDGVYYTESEVDTLLSDKANLSHTHTIANVSGLQSALDGKAPSSHGTHVSYSTTTPVMDGTASVGTASTVARSDHKHPTDTSRAAQASLDSHTSNKSNPHGVTLAQLGVTATATELNLLDGITATVTELNYVDGVTSSIQTQLNGKAASSHTHNYAGSSSAGGSANSANKLATARTISLTGDVTGSTSFDGSGNVSITATVADDSHNHTIANIDGLQTAINGKAATSHTHTADDLIQMAEALFGTNSLGGVEYSYGSNNGKNILTEISNMPQGFHTIYAIAGTTGNPESAESYRYFIHKTSSTIGWIYAFGADGSIYSNYLAGANTFKGWKTIHDAKRKPLWTGSYYMTAGHTVTPSKKLSQCEHGWMLLWSDYDPDTSTVNNTDFCTTMIPNRNWTGGTWNGAAYYCDVPRYTAGTATDSESRIIKVLNVYDNKLVGSANNNVAPRSDVVLRAVYEF